MAKSFFTNAFGYTHKKIWPSRERPFLAKHKVQGKIEKKILIKRINRDDRCAQVKLQILHTQQGWEKFLKYRMTRIPFKEEVNVGLYVNSSPHYVPKMVLTILYIKSGSLRRTV